MKLTRRGLFKLAGGTAVTIGFWPVAHGHLPIAREPDRDVLRGVIYLYGATELPVSMQRGVPFERIERIVDAELAGMKRDFMTFYAREAAIGFRGARRVAGLE